MIHLGRGSVVVENPPPALLRGLRRFNHDMGAYEDLYLLSGERNILVTAPGFARRVVELCPNEKVRDERIPMPEPVMPQGGFWNDAISFAIVAGGGIVSMPEVFGSHNAASAIIRAFPRDSLADRGTPVTLVAERDFDSARNMARTLKRLLPEREVEVARRGSYAEGDDVIVATYDSLDEMPLSVVGVFIGCGLSGGLPVGCTAKISVMRNAARWGVLETAFGGGDAGIDAEGLFGPVTASATFKDAVSAGLAAPVSVCWLPCPKPKTYLSRSPKLLEALTMQENESLMEVVADIALNTPAEIGCLCAVESVAAAKRIGGCDAQCVAQIHRKIARKDRLKEIESIESGVLRKAIIEEGMLPRTTSHAVMVVVTCGGADAAKRHIPCIPPDNGGRAYIVDFTHGWDLHNGRKGRLALNDDARRKCYEDMGFTQCSFEHFSQLPFL